MTTPPWCREKVMVYYYYYYYPKYQEEQFLYEFFEDKVADIYRILRRRDGILEDTSIYILTFDDYLIRYISDGQHVQ